MNNDLISREWLKDAFDNLCCHNCKMCRNFRNEDSFYKCNLIDNAPAVNVEFELKAKNGVTYPKALDQMTFSHELSVEEQQNIITVYMLGTNANIRPQGEWIFGSTLGHGWMKCSNCCVSQSGQTSCWSYCPNCGADMRGNN